MPISCPAFGVSIRVSGNFGFGVLRDLTHMDETTMSEKNKACLRIDTQRIREGSGERKNAKATKQKKEKDSRCEEVL